MKAMSDDKNQDGIRFGETAWIRPLDEKDFSAHTALIEATQWRYLREDLGKTGGRALEVGCGSGHFGALLAQVGFDTVLLDYSPAALECAKNSYVTLGGRERKSYVQGDARSLPFSGGSFDVVVSCGVLEHFEALAPVIQEMARVLRPGGFFYADIVPRKFSRKAGGSR